MASYEINVKRPKDPSSTQGTLKYKGGISVSSKCWWREDKRIPAGSYSGCSATTMATKKYNAVFIPGVKGFTGIFIHVGGKPKDSNGCVVIPKAKIKAIYDDIDPKDGKNVKVVIKDG